MSKELDMRRTSALLLFFAVYSLPTLVLGVPIVSIYSDQLTQDVKTTVTDLAGISHANSDGYSGQTSSPLISQTITSYFQDMPCSAAGCADSNVHYAKASTSVDSVTGDVELRAYTYVSWNDGPATAAPVWDNATPLIQEAVSELSWVFSVSEDTTISIGSWKDGGDGFASFFLEDLSSSTVLFDEGYSHYGESRVVNLQADRRYYVNLLARDADFNDNSHGYAYLDFEDGTTFVSVATPGIFSLFLIGLAGISASRRLNR